MTVSVQGTSSLVAPTGATSYNVPMPSSSASGDAIVVISITRGSIVLPPQTGWTYLGEYAASGSGVVPRTTAHWRELSAAAPSTYNFDIGTSTTIGGFVVYLLRKTTGTWVVDINGTNSDTSSPYPAPAIALFAEGVAMSAVSSYGNAGYTMVAPSSPFVEVVNRVASGTTTPLFSSGYQTYSSATTAGPWSYTSTHNFTTSPITVGAYVNIPVSNDLTGSATVTFSTTARLGLKIDLLGSTSFSFTTTGHLVNDNNSVDLSTIDDVYGTPYVSFSASGTLHYTERDIIEVIDTSNAIQFSASGGGASGVIVVPDDAQVGDLFVVLTCSYGFVSYDWATGLDQQNTSGGTFSDLVGGDWHRDTLGYYDSGLIYTQAHSRTLIDPIPYGYRFSAGGDIGAGWILLRKPAISGDWTRVHSSGNRQTTSPYIIPDLTVSENSVFIAAAGAPATSDISGYVIEQFDSPTDPNFIVTFNKPPTNDGPSEDANSVIAIGGYEYAIDGGTIDDIEFPAPFDRATYAGALGVSYVVPTDVEGTASVVFDTSATLGILTSISGGALLDFETISRLIPDMADLKELSTSTVIGFSTSSDLRVRYFRYISGSAEVVFDVEADLEVTLPLFSITLNYPIGGEKVVTASPVLSLSLTQTEPANGLANVEVQVSDAEDFSTTLVDYRFNTTSVYGSQETIPLVIRLSDSTIYYWRARIERDDGSYDPWTDVASFVVDLTIGDIGEYILWGDAVDTGEVTPHLWYVVDPRVYSNTADTITIVGMGFGDKDATVKFDDETLSIVSQSVVPADADGLGEARIIASIGNDVNVEHDFVEVTIANDIEAPGGNVTIETSD